MLVEPSDTTIEISEISADESSDHLESAVAVVTDEDFSEISFNDALVCTQSNLL